MAATALITAQTTPFTSADFAVTAGAPVAVSLNQPNGLGFLTTLAAWVEIKSSGGSYAPIPGGLLSGDRAMVNIIEVGDYRVSKPLSQVAYGVDRS